MTEENIMDKPGWEWIPLVEQHKQDLIDTGYSEFRNTLALKYMTDNTPYWYGFPNTVYGITEYYIKLKKLGVNVEISDSLDGNPVYVSDNNKIITQDLLTTAEEIDFLKSSIDLLKINSIVEIGGGYGRTARYILNLYPHIKYTIVDIPPTIDVAKQFLSNNLSNHNINYILPSEYIDSQIQYDLAISISTLYELTQNHRAGYFKKINNNINYFYYKDRDVIFEEFEQYNWNLINSQKSRTTTMMFDYLFKIKN